MNSNKIDEDFFLDKSDIADIKFNYTNDEEILWLKTKKIYNLYNDILHNKKMLFFRFFYNFSLMKYFFYKIYHFDFKKIKKIDFKYGFYESYRELQFDLIFKKKTIKKVYEFGSGYSTYKLASLLHNQAKNKSIEGKLISFDQSVNWLNKVKKEIPEHLHKYIEFNYLKPEYLEFQKLKFLRFPITKYEKDIDLVYVDGPTASLINNWDKSKNRKIYCNGNLVDLLKEKNADYVITDKRFLHYEVFKKLNFSNYNIKLNHYLRSVEMFRKN